MLAATFLVLLHHELVLSRVREAYDRAPAAGGRAQGAPTPAKA